MLLVEVYANPTSQNLTAGTRLFRAHDPVKVRVGDTEFNTFARVVRMTVNLSSRQL